MGELARRVVAKSLLAEEPPAPPARYEILRELGRGGAGAVYLATDRQLRRPVALKFLQHARPADMERFVREARFTARLNSPSVVQVYEAGEAQGVPFIAMQYVDGGNLATMDLDVRGVLEVARDVAHALAHAHREGIVHRDIKPENILVDRGRRAFLTDFGIARDLRQELGETISAEGQIMGTPALMPPEQAKGAVHEVDARSDIYSLGATLYTKLTGHWPFDKPNVVDLLHAVIHEQPPLPRSLNPAIPREVEDLIVRCMRKRRADRYPTMADVAKALDGCLRGEGPAASAWFASYVRRTVPDAPAKAPGPPEDHAEWEAALAAAREIAAYDAHLYRVRANLPRHFPPLDAVIARLDGVLAEEPAAGWARFYRGLARFRRGDLRGAVEDMERAVDRVRDRTTAYYELGRAYLALYLADHEAAHGHISREGTAHHLESARSRLEQAALAFAEARELPRRQKAYAEAVRRLAEQDFAGCVARCEEIVAEEPDIEEVWKLMGDAQRLSGGDPLPAYARALEVRRSFFEVELARGEVFLARGDRRAARECATRALEIHPSLPEALVLLARAGDEDDALRLAREARAAGPASYQAAVALAEMLLARDDPTGALVELEAARALDGCQNRVSQLRVRALLRRGIGGGPGGRADLDSALFLCREHAGHEHDPQWEALGAEVRRALGASP